VKYFSWIVTVPLTLVAVVFAVTNRAGVTLNLWPFGITIEAPLFILVLGSVFIGVLVGGTIAWLSAGATRRRAREAQRRAANLERELAQLRRQQQNPHADGIDTRDAPAAPALSGGPPGART